MYTSLFLDLDNTLLDFNKAEAYAVSRVLKNNGLPFDGKTVKLYSDINRSFWESFERGFPICFHKIPKKNLPNNAQHL